MDVSFLCTFKKNLLLLALKSNLLSTGLITKRVCVKTTFASQFEGLTHPEQSDAGNMGQSIWLKHNDEMPWIHGGI